jgi:hypothetical protein
MFTIPVGTLSQTIDHVDTVRIHVGEGGA